MLSIALLAIASLVAAQNGTFTPQNGTMTQNPIVDLFIPDALGGKGQYVVSVIGACVDHTTYAIRCTAGPSPCGPSNMPLTIVEGPSAYSAAYTTTISTLGAVVSGAIVETCSLQGTTAAVCTEMLSAAASGKQTQISTTATLTGSNYHRFQVPVTAGAQNTASATGACPPSPTANGASPKNIPAISAVSMMAAVALTAILML